MSTTSAIDNSAKPEKGKYSKRFNNFSKQESQLVLQHYDKNADLASLTSRPQLLEKLFIAKPEFIIDALDRLFCFEIKQDGVGYRISYVSCEHDDEYPERPTTSTQVDVAGIIRNLQKSIEEKNETEKQIEVSNDRKGNEIDSLERNSDLSEHNYHTPHQLKTSFKLPIPEKIEPQVVTQDVINVSLVDTLQSISNRLQSPTLSKKPFVSKNLHYDDTEDISVFFNKISASAQGQGLKSDSDKINMAIQVLSSSSTGSQLLGLCSEEDYTDWKRFCQKLLRMTGSSHKSYEQQFLAYERLPGQPSSLLMAKLIDLYRRSCEYSETHKLNKFEERHIRMRFMLCLEPQLRSLLEDRLSSIKEDINLEQLSQKCQELEVFYRLGSNKPKTVNTIKQETSFTDKQFKTLLEAVQNLSTTNQPRTKRPPINDPQLLGFCMRHVKGTCPFGEKCKYKHSKVPENVLKHMKQRYNITPKTA